MATARPSIVDRPLIFETGSPLLLAIDTCGATGSVALGTSDCGLAGPGPWRVLATAELPGKTYSAHLVAGVDQVLRTADVALADIHALIIVNGPGSFTGVRVGVSAAKGLAEGADIPLICLSRLKLLARQATGDACAAIDAGRGEFYFGLYRDNIRHIEALYSAVEVSCAARDSGLPVVVYEETACARLTSSMPRKDLILVPAPTGADALRLGVGCFIAGAFVDVTALDGNYLRRPDAENAVDRIATSI